MANQMTITFNVENQILSRTDTNRIVEKSKNYLVATFNFSSDWEGTRKSVIIEKDNLKFKKYLDENNSCVIPNRTIIYDGFSISVVGEDSNEYITITTSILFIAVNKNNVPEEVNPYIREITSETLDVEKENETCNIEIPDRTYFSDIEFLNDVLKFLDLKGNTIKELEFDYGKVNNITITIDNTTYKLTLTAYDKNNTILFTREVDFNIEGMLVKSATYDSQNKELVIVFQNDNVVRIPLSDLLTGIATESWVVANYYNKTQNDILLEGKQNVIDNNNKLSSDLVDDTSGTNKFVTTSEKQVWNSKQDVISGSDSVDVTSNVVSVKQTYIDNQFLTTNEMNDLIEEVYGSEYTL